MKLKVLVILVMVVALLSGCASESARGFILDPNIITASDETQPANGVTDSGNILATIPTTKAKPPTPFEITQKDDLLLLSADLIYPAKIVCQVTTGVTFDQWFMDDFYPVLGHKMGEKMGVVIYNAQDKDCLFSLEYEPVAYPYTDKKSGITYEPTPYEAKEWFKIPEKIVLLKAHELKTVPVSFKIPLNYPTPDNWIARIVVTNESTRSFVTGNGAVSYLFTMVR